MRSRGLRRASLVVVAAVAGAGVWIVRSSRDPLPPAPTPPARPGPSSYHAVYRVEETTAAAPVVSTELVWVRRPHESRVERRAGPPPGDSVRSATIANREFLWTLKEDGAVAAGFRRPPGPPSRDASPPAFASAARRGVVRELDPSEVIGLRCRRFEYREPSPRPFRLPSGERVESCVTADGIVLREEWTVAGKLARLTEAVTLELDPDLGPDRLFVGRVPTSQESRFAAQEVVQDKRPPPGSLRPSVPRGFVRDRSAGVSGQGGGSIPRQTFVETYRRGLELVVVEQAVAGSPSPPWPRDEGVKVRLGSVPGRLVLFQDHAEVRSAAGKTRFRVGAPTVALAMYFARTLA